MTGAREKPATGGTVSGPQSSVGKFSNPKHSEAVSNRQEFVLAALRSVSLRIRLIDNEIAAAGIALKGGLISPETALEWVEEVAPGCIGFIPEAVQAAKQEAA